ncbi:alpha/beta hydrolase [Bradyrhizobium prioriisuperbiae]|uniref:alpha/beta fold hydrolase n=1 Tax=Bradyrhizobium prioriisuperbiae TaxID=2854389 RepID=UPI0028E30C0E|nr:alpha/beta hydrolase [Bradyrhizobium prioritasuperba]
MSLIWADGIDIEYEDVGSADQEVVLLIMGMGAQLTMWPVEMCEELTRRGYRVVRFDNRNAGLSTKFANFGLPDHEAVAEAKRSGAPLPIPYSLSDMAADAVGLLDALSVPMAHIVGASMGGMIAQLVATDYPERTLSLTVIMSTAANPDIPLIGPKAMAIFTPPPADDAASVIEHAAMTTMLRGSPAYPTAIDAIRAAARADYERDYNPDGVARQMAAVAVSLDRRAKLRTVKRPTIVVHGTDDPILPIEAARDIATSVPDAELRIIDGMGHDFSVGLVPIFVDAIASVAAKSGE